MREACEDFLAARLAVPGLAAGGARLPDGTVLPRCFTRWLSPNQVVEAVTRLVQAAQELQPYCPAPTQTIWSFEHLRVYLRLRPDKACLGLFLENRPGIPVDEIERALEEFAALPWR